MIRLTKKDFRSWLEKNRSKIVGNAESPDNCPICRFMKSQGAKTVEVQISYRRIDGRNYAHSLWQRNFQRQAISQQRELRVSCLRGLEALEALDAAK